jgi:hypothetical protein
MPMSYVPNLGNPSPRDKSPELATPGPILGIGMKKAIAIILFFFLSSPPSWAETYNEWVENCRSYKDVALWLNHHFRYEKDRNGDGQPFSKGNKKRPGIQRLEEIFQSRYGCTLDASLFAKDTLNRINPDYRAEIIYLSLDRSQAHYLCGFILGENLFIMDYGNLYENMIGTHGPFKNLDHYVHLFYFRWHPHQKKPQVYHFGFPSSKAR